jgi:hypothetical protein
VCVKERARARERESLFVFSCQTLGQTGQEKKISNVPSHSDFTYTVVNILNFTHIVNKLNFTCIVKHTQKYSLTVQKYPVKGYFRVRSKVPSYGDFTCIGNILFSVTVYSKYLFFYQ